MNKKIVSLTVALVMIFCLTLSAMPTVFAVSNKGISASASTVERGSNIIVTYKVAAQTKKVSDMNLIFTFNNSAFELTDFNLPAIEKAEYSPLDYGDSDEGADNKAESVTAWNNNGSASFGYVSKNGKASITVPDTSITFTFKAKTTAAVGSYSFTVTGYDIGSLDDAGLPDAICDISALTSAEKSVSVTVTAPTVAVTGITLNKSTLTLNDGANEKLIATVAPDTATDKTVTWSSSDKTVATVSADGTVTAVKKGNATITAKTANGKTATCAVTVNCVHSFIEKVDAKYLKTTATCKSAAVYYKSCSKCGEKDTITFTNGGKNPANHVGGTELRNAVEATCYSKGYTGDTYCKGCEAKISTGSEIGKKNHTESSEWQSDGTYHWHNCTVVACGVKIESTKSAHSYEWKIDTPATEDATGLKHEECSVCHRTRNVGTIIPKLDHTHTGITHHAAVAATCKSTGTVEYWTCSSPKCAGKYYSDAACANQILNITTSKNASNHVGGTELRNAKTATCYAKGYTGDTYCKGCNQLISKGKDVEMTKHTPVWKSDGTKHWQVCSVPACGAVIEGTTAVHTGGEATCVSKKVCSVCTAEYGAVDAGIHKNTEIINAKPATCTVAGYTGDTYCKDCKKTIVQGKAIEPTGEHVDADGKWESNNTDHWHTCGCGASFDKAAHTASDWKIDKEAAVGVKGSQHKECTVCGKVLETAEIPALADKNDDGKSTAKNSGDTFDFVLVASIVTIALGGLIAATVTKKKRSHK